MYETDSSSSQTSLHPLRRTGRHRISRKSTEMWRQRPLRDTEPEQLARALGWFSLGLGLAELLAPRAVSRLYGGSGRHTTLIRLAGMREIAAGMTIFGGGRRPVSGLWARVAGDMLDLATLGAAATSRRTNRKALAFATANVLGVTALDLLCAQEMSRRQGVLTDDGAVRVIRSIVINRPREEVYRFWRDFENLPRFMRHLQSVRTLDERRSHWVTSAPRGGKVEWESELTADQTGALIAWRSVEGSQVENAGTVRFEPRPGGRGTIVRVELEYRPPGGLAGAALATVFGESAQQQLHDDLHRLKQVLETGDVVRSDGSPEGIGSIRQRPARPQTDAGQPQHLAESFEPSTTR